MKRASSGPRSRSVFDVSQNVAPIKREHRQRDFCSNYAGLLLNHSTEIVMRKTTLTLATALCAALLSVPALAKHERYHHGEHDGDRYEHHGDHDGDRDRGPGEHEKSGQGSGHSGGTTSGSGGTTSSGTGSTTASGGSGFTAGNGGTSTTGSTGGQ